MIKMKPTVHQLLAISHDGENILVSAGAGSGKTAVLTERVLAKLSKGILIDDLIILTFTNAAAAEMKTRIKDKILENPKFSKQLKRLDNAVIATFDSFALGIVKEYHYLIGLPSNVRIADSVINQKIKDKILDEVLQESYITSNKMFISTVDRLYDRGDKTYRDAVMTLYNGLEYYPDRFEYLDNYEDRFYSSTMVNTAVDDFRQLFNRRIEEIILAIKLMIEKLSEIDDEKIYEFLQIVKNQYTQLKTNADPQTLFAFFKDFSHPTLPRLSKEIQEIYGETIRTENDRVKGLVYNFRDDLNKLFVDDIEQAKQAIIETKPSVLAVVASCKAFLIKLNAYKKAHNLFEYTDIMNLAIKIIEDFPDVSNQYRNRIDEIMVDEYQDTNDLQDYLLHLFDRGNLFMVGDVKQSIYGFRNANPGNFIAKYHDYETKGTGKTIDLLENFRSRKETLSGINDFFSDIMDEEIGGVNYKDRQALICGNLDYDLHLSNQTDYSPEVFVYRDETDIIEKKSGSFPKAYREGQIIATDISRKIKQGFCIYDSHEQKNRPVKYSDFAVLVDRKSGFNQYQKALMDQGIPVISISDEKYIAATEILFIHNSLCLLKCFADPVYFSGKFNRSLYGVARSFVYQIPDNIIIPIINDLQIQSFVDIAKLGSIPSFSRLYTDFSSLAKTVFSLPLEDMLLALYRQTELFSKLVSLPDPESVEAKLMFLVAKAKELSEYTFDDLLNYFQDLYDMEELDIEYSRPYDSSSNAVRMMTMHKSKGLEFPICYYPGLYKRFNYTESKSFFIFDKQYGLITKAWDNGFKETILHQLNRWYNYKDYVSERLRLFYVALTRAKEKIIMIYDGSKEKKPLLTYNRFGYLDAIIRQRYSSFKDILESVPIVKNWQKEVDDSSDINYIQSSLSTLMEEKPIIYPKINIKTRTITTEVFSKPSIDFLTAAEKASLKYGEWVHKELELFNFADTDASLKRLPDQLRKSFATLLLQSELKGIDDAKIHQEYEFFDERDNKSFRGVIDLLIEYPDRIVIIDYKLKKIDDLGYINQLNGYRKFVEKVTSKPIYTYLYSLSEQQIIAIGGV